MSSPLPRVLVSSVIRSAIKGDSHGGVYVVDLEDDDIEQVLDWNDCGIDFEGRGGDRGLRGIAFHGDVIVLAASNEIFVFDRDFDRLDSFTNRYLRSCHETHLDGDTLWVTSTSYDSILALDLRSGRFEHGVCFRRVAGDTSTFEAWEFDPNDEGGPELGDTFHINSVFSSEGARYVCGTGLEAVYSYDSDGLGTYAPVPHGTHNGRPFRGGVLFNDTAGKRVVYRDGEQAEVVAFDVPSYPAESLLRNDLGKDHARQAWGRGLAVHGELLIAGSSPATIAVHDMASGETVKTLNLTMDVRNAVHGLEVLPYGDDTRHRT